MATLFAAQPGSAQPGAIGPGDPGSAAPGGGGPAVTTTSLPNGEVGVAYNATLTAAGGTPPYTWLLGGGLALPGSGLPAGLTLTAAGTVTGTPTTAGIFTFGVTVTDSSGHSAQAVLSITVIAAFVSQFDSLIISDHIELLGGSVPSANPACAGAIFKLQPGFDLGAPQPTTDIVASLILDGERPFGYRASNRTITLPIMIHAPDFDTLAGAYEVLMQAVDQQTWTLTWTRAQSALPLVLDCFRAQPTVIQYGGVDQMNINPIGVLQLTFTALPYGRADQPLTVTVASPLQGQPSPPAAVVIDSFSSVSYPQWNQSSRHVTGPNSAQWNPCNPPLSDCTGRGSDPGAVYSATLASPVNILGLTALSVEAGFGTDYFHTWHEGPAVFAFTLTDSSGDTLSFSRTIKVHASDDSTSPKWQRVTAAIPQGSVGFNYASVAAWSVTITNWKVKQARWVNIYLDALIANPPSLQNALPIRGAMYSVLGVSGSARAPMSAQFQQPPGTASPVSVLLPGPPGSPQTWVCPAGVTSATVECGGGNGAGGSQPKGSNNNCAGGGGAGEYAAETLVTLTPLARYTYTVGAGGQFVAGAAGTAGGVSTFSGDNKTVTANGGGGGAGGSNGAAGAGGTGSTNTTHYSGGAGAAGVNNSHSGGGGGSAGSTGAGGNASGATGGAAGTGSTPGQAGASGVTGSGDGANGAAAGSGAWTGSDAENGGDGAAGYIKLTYTPAVASFSTLLVHRPGPTAPEDLSPIVTFGDTDTPNGSIEYPLQTLIAGQYAGFGGTYSVVIVANAWNSPSASRTVTLAVKQYEFAGGPSYSTSVARTFTPNTDITNGIVVLGELTLPLKDVAPDNAAGLYTITVTDTNTSDTFLDALFLDTLGQTVLVNDATAAAYVNFFVDEPTPDRDLGRIMGSVFDRSAAISVLDSSLVSGGPLFLNPGDNLLLCYAVEGAPALNVTYFPRFWLDRTS